MRSLSYVYMLIIIPASLLLGGCADNIADVISQAGKIQTDVTTKINDVKEGVDNVISEVERARDTLIEKKRQLEQAVADIQDATASIDTLLSNADKQISDIGISEEAPIDATTTTDETADLESKKAALEAALAELNAALTETNTTLATEAAPAE